MKKINFIGLGTAAIGRPQYINVRQENTKEVSLAEFKNNGYHVLEEAYKNGVRYFDTAPGYGLAEQLVMEWLYSKGYNDVEIASKWGYTYTANFDPNAISHEVKDHSLNKLKEQWKYTQKLLPALSTYQIHSATFESGVLENTEVFDYLGKLKQEKGLKIGLTSSGSNQKQIIESALEIERNGSQLFDAFQVTYNILDQSILELKEKLGSKRIIVKEALANGRVFPNEHFPEYQKLYQELTKLAAKYNVGIDAIALRFVIDTLTPFKVLSGASEKKHIKENLLAESFQLEKEELDRLKSFSSTPEEYWGERKQLAWN
ncbi:aldo/keto reductase [Flammeovirga yaeyamensis]|uniref:Aldo/keto reductase n=1 Tax=Flammeovirga yaeyamensis TaxID=367791 RepID=A0AAX1NCX7_9BACT|nr:aldo/keto reductase [Flammeovirga yaeyamensis]MBB3696736.1 aryl-alcohol dehydrogenase-like predicted oxidoreductase [Flammeovirga yaeyamensis]NMF33406.1 aldo/keto reductase [Flammeovirga yaeyamensis]QWG05320.1 aldo/keto reductase [Flammeovirga yaeyamensis]